MTTHEMKAGSLEYPATAQSFPSIWPPLLPQAVVGEGQEEHYASHAWECPWQPQAEPGHSDKLVPSIEGPGPLGPSAGGKGCRGRKWMNGLSPGWVICPHRSLLVHLPTLSCHNSSRCSRARRPMAKVSLELMRVQLCRCRLKIQGATKRAPPPLGGGARGHAFRRFPQVPARTVRRTASLGSFDV